MYKKAILSAAVAAALSGGVFSTTVVAEDGVEKLEKIQVTGSRISRVDAEGMAPVTVISREDIERSGSTTVAEVLRSLTENGGGSYDESFTNSFAPGSASVSLRGLGASRTLTLLNGRRVANYGFAQNINDTGVDLNSIPLSAVERVEVLKDGASAIYGSDAIAGVVNIILKKDFEGAEVSTSYGQTDKGDGQEGQLNLVTGTSLGDSGNVMVSFDYMNRDDIMMRDRNNTASANQSNNGGIDWRSSRSIYPLVVGETTGQVCNDPTGGNCRYDYANDVTLMPSSERYGLLTNFNFDINDDVSLFSEVSFSRSITDQRSAATPHFAAVTNAPASVSASNPNNPYGEDVSVYSRYQDVGARLNEIDSKTYRLVGGLNGAFVFEERDVDWEVSVGYSKNNVINEGTNYIHEDNLNAAIANGSYNPFEPTSNSQDVIDTFRVSTKRESDSALTFATANASMPIFELPAGDVYLAVGAEWRKESIEDTPDPLSAGGDLLASGGTGSEGDRKVKAAYAELAIPLHETLEMQLAGRWEDYSDFGTTVDPKVAFRWQPLDNLMLRASYTTSFKAPTLPELYAGNSVSYEDLTDTTGCEANRGTVNEDFFCESKQYQTVQSGNEDLDAETAETFNFGIVYEPIDNLQAKLDLYKIRNSNLIDTVPAQQLIDTNSDAVVRGDVGGRDDVILYIDNQYVNVSKQQVEGVDAELSYSWDTSMGAFEATYKSSFIHSYKIAAADGVLRDRTGEAVGSDFGGSGPRLKSKYILGWELNDERLTGTLNYTSSYEQRYQFEEKQVEKLYTLDLQYTYSGLADTTITLGIDNVTDEEAPFYDGSWEGFELGTHGNRGRFVYGKVNYVF